MNVQFNSRNLPKSVSLVWILWITISINLFAQQPELIWISSLGGNDSEARAVSDDGSVVVGVSVDVNGNLRAVRWTMQTGIQDLGTLGGDGSEATDVSADGSIIVGWADDANNIYRAFKWTETTGMQDLGAGDYSKANGISSDGTAIIIDVYPSSYRWTQAGGLVDLGTLGGSSSSATDISSDSSVICGFSYVSAGDPYAFRWVEGTGMVQIGTFYSFGLGISDDGNTVTGFETGSAGLYKAFRWTQSGGFEFNIAGNFSQGNAVSGDGSIIVGYFSGGAFRLSTTNGLDSLNQTYSSLLSSGSDLSIANGISSDGQFIVGEGTNGTTTNQEGFLLAVNGISSVDETKEVPQVFVLNQNYPNPFNPSTKIQYTIGSKQIVTLKVYDLLGNEVATLVNEEKPAGSYEVEFNSHSGLSGIKELSSGIYFYQLRASNSSTGSQSGQAGQGFVQTKKMLMIK